MSTEKEKAMLNMIVQRCIEKNGGKSDFSYPHGALANLLSDCELHIDMPSGFGNRYGRDLILFIFKTDDEDILSELLNMKKTLISICDDCVDERYELPLDEEGEPFVEIKKVLSVTKLPSAPVISFEQNESLLLNEIQSAEHSIFAAVSWLTNDKIISALESKAKNGVVVFLIVNDDDINFKILSSKDHSFPISSATNMNDYWKMHHKFCIIDNAKVLYGSFNWTKNATNNDENLTLDKNSSSVDAFTNEFKKLRIKYNCFWSYSYCSRKSPY